MENEALTLNPKKVFQYFFEIVKIPRESGHEEAITDYLLEFAKEHHLDAVRDTYHNVIIRKKGYKETFFGEKEKNKTVILQGHTDMVCEKTSKSTHDFSKDPISIRIKDGNIYADGTTLGADNGIAVAVMLAVLSDPDMVHPPLECVFTSSEEVGLIGAAGLDKRVLTGRRMINLDSEEEGVATISCAGGVRMNCVRRASLSSRSGISFKITLDHLQGGHSGADIHLPRANANIIMARILCRLQENEEIHLISLNGGNKDNAIPRNTEADLLADSMDALSFAKKCVEDFQSVLNDEIRKIEPDFQLSFEQGKETETNVYDRESFLACVRFEMLAPNGVQYQQQNPFPFVISSVNHGIVKTNGEEILLVFSPRSSVDSMLELTKTRILLLAQQFGFSVTLVGAYPGWKYAESSKLRDVFSKVYQQEFHQTLRLEAIHAGLECGIFCNAIPELDAIAVGPDIFDCHTPNEHLPIASVERFYQLLLAALKQLEEED